MVCLGSCQALGRSSKNEDDNGSEDKELMQKRWGANCQYSAPTLQGRHGQGTMRKQKGMLGPEDPYKLKVPFTPESSS